LRIAAQRGRALRLAREQAQQADDDARRDETTAQLREIERQRQATA
jgi:hypothetical protein